MSKFESNIEEMSAKIAVLDTKFESLTVSFESVKRAVEASTETSHRNNELLIELQAIMKGEGAYGKTGAGLLAEHNALVEDTRALKNIVDPRVKQHDEMWNAFDTGKKWWILIAGAASVFGVTSIGGAIAMYQWLKWFFSRP